MATHKDDSFRYRRDLSRPMAELLSDPFSELTRKRQSSLLIAATVALLLSAGLVNVADVGVSSLKFKFEAPQIATWLAFAVTLYLLIAYLTGVWADWAIAKAKCWSPLAKTGDVVAAMKADQERRLQAGKARSEQIDRLNAEKLRIEADIQPRLDSIHAREQAVDDAISSIKIESASSEELAEKNKLVQEATELVRADMALRREMQDRVWSVIVARNELAQSISLEPTALMWAERADIDETIGTFSHLTQLRLVFEIIFPAVYGVFGLVWIIRHA